MHTLLQALDVEPPMATAISTGLAELDQETGGLRAGQLWVITADPGHGSSSLIAQWAALAATTSRAKVQLISPRDDARQCAARMLASTAKVPVQLLLHDRLTEQQSAKVADARSRLAQADLHIAALGCASWAITSATQSAPPEPLALFIDDTHLIPSVAHRTDAVVRQGGLVVMAMPRREVNHEFSAWSDLPAWWKSADVVLEVQSHGINPAVHTDRPGEADIRLLRNRFGLCGQLTVAFQGHYARFVPMC